MTTVISLLHNFALIISFDRKYSQDVETSGARNVRSRYNLMELVFIFCI